MFSRKTCYFFVRPKRSFLELCVFFGRTLKAPQMRRVDRASKSKVVHFIRITHRDEVEPPITSELACHEPNIRPGQLQTNRKPARLRVDTGASRSTRGSWRNQTSLRTPVICEIEIVRQRELNRDAQNISMHLRLSPQN
jgi:uncharacterized protein DUF5655